MTHTSTHSLTCSDEGFLIPVLFSKWSQWPGLGQAEARSLALDSDFSCGWQGPRGLGHLLLIPQLHQQGTGPEVEHLGLELNFNMGC